MWRSSSCIPSSSLMAELLTPSPRESSDTLWKKLASMTSILWTPHPAPPSTPSPSFGATQSWRVVVIPPFYSWKQTTSHLEVAVLIVTFWCSPENDHSATWRSRLMKPKAAGHAEKAGSQSKPNWKPSNIPINNHVHKNLCINKCAGADLRFNDLC